ncbi:hypothetical protein LSH36_557g00091 [Paralvinella palmiformis]|uniref:Laminin G domain-containing protein n=1 Tax=Paralvinella palmiformis TaxID=53620 RepID=A0AAD9J6F7_9ANNE|nr:hypothetical protein LSH36_557g00091 [Paralvinella palmiformis]
MFFAILLCLWPLLYPALSLLLKSNSTLFYHELPLSKTYPEPYNIIDGKWHYIHVFKGPGVRKWTLSIDDVKPVEENIIPGLTNVTILNKKAYFGGRPDYTAHQFQGIIRNVVLNGEWTSLHAGRTNGLSEVVDCDSGRAKEYKAFIISQYKLLNNPGNAMLYQ